MTISGFLEWLNTKGYAICKLVEPNEEEELTKVLMPSEDYWSPTDESAEELILNYTKEEGK